MTRKEKRKKECGRECRGYPNKSVVVPALTSKR
jgi:hypothetical protein